MERSIGLQSSNPGRRADRRSSARAASRTTTIAGAQRRTQSTSTREGRRKDIENTGFAPGNGMACEKLRRTRCRGSSRAARGSPRWSSIRLVATCPNDSRVQGVFAVRRSGRKCCRKDLKSLDSRPGMVWLRTPSIHKISGPGRRGGFHGVRFPPGPAPPAPLQGAPSVAPARAGRPEGFRGRNLRNDRQTVPRIFRVGRRARTSKCLPEPVRFGSVAEGQREGNRRATTSLAHIPAFSRRFVGAAANSLSPAHRARRRWRPPNLGVKSGAESAFVTSPWSP